MEWACGYYYTGLECDLDNFLAKEKKMSRININESFILEDSRFQLNRAKIMKREDESNGNIAL